VFRLGDGVDTINESSGYDRILFESGVNLTEVALFRNGYNLEIGYGTTDKITVTNYFLNSDFREALFATIFECPPVAHPRHYRLSYISLLYRMTDTNRYK
jgi:hypothetical protein